MDYCAIAASIKEKAETMGSATSNIKSSSFDSIWKGSAHDNLISDLSNSLTRINDQKKSAKAFAEALEKIEKYKNNKKEIEILYASLDAIVDDETNSRANISKRKRIGNKIEYYRGLNAGLRGTINSALNGISSINSELTKVNYDPTSDSNYKEYVVNIQELASLFKSGNLKTFGMSSNSSSFYDYYSNEEINTRLNEIKSQYTGRDAAVNCALGVMEMAASVGGKLNLGWGTPSTTYDSNTLGNEYSSFASWAVNQGCSNNNLTAAKIVNNGTSTTYEQAQKGDVLVSSSGSLVMIVDNNTDEQEFLVAEVSNANDGVVVQSKSYASLTGNYQALDLSSIYND